MFYFLVCAPMFCVSDRLIHPKSFGTISPSSIRVFENRKVDSLDSIRPFEIFKEFDNPINTYFVNGF
uniref:Secreted protein n=1 Tax=Steinernema glaseri TaxID=37863 RepID=A0A1I8ARA3_9BILA